MSIMSLFKGMEEKLMDVHLFIRYFDASDLEFLGFKPEVR